MIKYCPGPWHDAIATAYAQHRDMPIKFAHLYWQKKHNLTPDQAKAIYQWCKREDRDCPCPVTVAA